jgi:hypothetical protein
MKNIHLIATDKPSRLIIFSTFFNEFRLLDNPIHDWKHKQHIYITSDEEIKEGDWYLINGQSYSKYDGHFTLGIDCKKIILTTDTDLIKDGIQAIDDEFLEWFVKNLNCEFVEVIHKFDEDWSEESGAFEIDYYKIIIPQEEKQETLEEVAFRRAVERRWHPNSLDTRRVGNEIIESVKFGAKWQAERMYSEEEVLELLHKRMIYTLGNDYQEITTTKWFEQFKKK